MIYLNTHSQYEHNNGRGCISGISKNANWSKYLYIWLYLWWFKRNTWIWKSAFVFVLSCEFKCSTRSLSDLLTLFELNLPLFDCLCKPHVLTWVTIASLLSSFTMKRASSRSHLVLISHQRLLDSIWRSMGGRLYVRKGLYYVRLTRLILLSSSQRSLAQESPRLNCFIMQIHV